MPVTEYDSDDDAGEVLELMLVEGRPVLNMRNTVDGFMRDLKLEITERAEQLAVDAAD